VSIVTTTSGNRASGFGGGQDRGIVMVQKSNFNGGLKKKPTREWASVASFGSSSPRSKREIPTDGNAMATPRVVPGTLASTRA